MATQADSGATDKSGLRKLALPGAVAAAGAGIGFLVMNKPKRLPELLKKLPGGANDLFGDLKDRVQSVGGGSASAPQPTGQISQSRLNEFEARRRERKKRRDRRQRATT
jgi:hypothetical protein